MITVDHEFAKEIMDYLSEYEDIKGDEDHLIGEPVINAISISGIWKLERHLNLLLDEDYNFSFTSLTFIKA